MKSRMRFYDTTLHDLAQWGGGSLPTEAMARLAGWLDGLGVSYLEVGAVVEEPETIALYRRLNAGAFFHARLAASARWKFAEQTLEQSASIRALLASEAPVCTLLIGPDEWGAHDSERQRNLLDGVRTLKAHQREVHLNAAHFFDTFKDDPQRALALWEVAERGGADVIVLCDTRGRTLPWEIGRIVAQVRARWPQVVLGVHAANEVGCAVANTLAAVGQGVGVVYGAVHAVGARSGGASLANIIPDLELRMGRPGLVPGGVAGLLEVSHQLSGLAEFHHAVGESVFAPL